ncbi:MAG: alpha/beta hydrolase [Actinomycetota bacterium]|nr:alpha/beta hydrolase [Actinomycetota bacterium]
MKPRLLLVPSFTELEWGIRPLLDRWAETASFDPPGVGGDPFQLEDAAAPADDGGALGRWRSASADRGLERIQECGWTRFVVVGDSHGLPTVLRVARRRPEAVTGLALGHASLSNSAAGERPPTRAGVWDALIELARQGNEALVRHGIAQMTRGGVSDELAGQMIERFPDMDVVTRVLEAIRREPEPIGDELASLDVPLLLAKHEGCLARTDEGFEDIVAAFPEAKVAICPETCTASPVFASALERFCSELAF